MRSAVRYCIIAGAVLGGASVLITAPSSPPLRDVEVPAMQLSTNSHDNPDANTPSVADLLQTMGGVEAPVVVQNITEFDGGVPAGIPGLSDLLNLGGDPFGTTDSQGKSFIDVGPLLPSDLTLAPPAGR